MPRHFARRARGGSVLAPSQEARLARFSGLGTNRRATPDQVSALGNRAGALSDSPAPSFFAATGSSLQPEGFEEALSRSQLGGNKILPLETRGAFTRLTPGGSERRGLFGQRGDIFRPDRFKGPLSVLEEGDDDVPGLSGRSFQNQAQRARKAPKIRRSRFTGNLARPRAL